MLKVNSAINAVVQNKPELTFINTKLQHSLS